MSRKEYFPEQGCLLSVGRAFAGRDGNHMDVQYAFEDERQWNPPNPNHGNLEVDIRLPLEEATFDGRNGVSTVLSISDIEVRIQTVKINESDLKAVFYSDWSTGTFESAFPELESVSSGISALEIDDAIHRVEAEFAQSEKNVSVFGFAVPISQLSSWGVLVLISVQLYLWLHLHEFASRIEPEADGWSVAWVGFYNSSIAKIVVFVSCAILPTSASLILGYRIMLIANSMHRAAMMISFTIVATSLSLGLLTVLRLKKLRDLAFKMPRARDISREG